MPVPRVSVRISLCPHCFCMTKTIKGRWGKCGLKKVSGRGEPI